MSAWETVIGLETHVELSTKTKAFCACPNRYGAEPNTCVCPTCMGLPGAMPAFQGEALNLSIKAGLALGCEIHEYSRFDRKNYFYPDLPKAYQITQFFHPLCTGGGVDITLADGSTKRIGITRIHMEEDAGKLSYDENGASLDFNRCGVPLIEIVTEPDLRSPEEASAYLRKLRAILVYAGVSDCRMNEGSLRCDVNISVHHVGEPFGTRTEIKNLNSFQSVERAILAESKRQIEVLENGGEIFQQTRRYDQKSGRTFGMRRKENSADYRYFPEPDLPPIVLTRGAIDAIAAELPMLPDARKAMYVQRFGIAPADAEILTAEKWLADYFEQASEQTKAPVILSRLLVGEVTAQLAKQGIAEGIPVQPGHIAKLCDMAQDGQINMTTMKAIAAQLLKEDTDPYEYAKEKDLFLLNDEKKLQAIAEQVIEQNASMVAAYHNGKTNVEKALMGKAMAIARGRADAVKLHEVLMKALAER